MQPEPPAVSPRRDVDEDEGIAEGEVDEPDGEEEVVCDGEHPEEEGGEWRRRVPGEHGEREAVADEAQHAEEAGEDRVDDEVRDDGASLVATVVVVYDGSDYSAVVHVLSVVTAMCMCVNDADCGSPVYLQRWSVITDRHNTFVLSPSRDWLRCAIVFARRHP